MSNLSQEKLKWFYDFQRRLKEEVDIDTTKKTDIGRIRFVNAEKVASIKEEVPCEKGDNFLDPEATTKIIRKQLPPQKVPFDEPIGLENEDLFYNAVSEYALVKRNSDMSEFEPPLNIENPMDVINAQETFDVQMNEKGEYSINTNLSDEQLEYVYTIAKLGKLYANSPVDNITAFSSPKSCFFTVADDNSCAKLIPAINGVDKLGDEKLNHFYKNNPKFLKNKLNHTEATEEAILQETDLNKVSNGRNLLMTAKTLTSSLQATAMDTEQKGLSTNIADKTFWQKARNGEFSNLLGESDGRTLLHYLPTALGQAGIDFDINEEKGFNSVFYYDKAQHRVFNIDSGLMNKDSEEIKAVVAERLKEGLKDGTIYAAAKDPLNGKTVLKSVSGSLNELGTTVNFSQPFPKVKEPGFFKKILHGIYSDWFKDEFDEYNTYRERVEEFNNAKKLIEKNVIYTNTKPEPEKRKPISEDEYKLKLAKGIIKARKEHSAEMYISMEDYKPEDVMKEPEFEEFHASEKGQDYAKKVMKGEGYPMSAIGVSYMEFQLDKIKKGKAELENNSPNKQIEKSAEKDVVSNDKPVEKKDEAVKLN